MTVLLKVKYRFNTNSIKIPATFFAEMERLILKLVWNLMGLQIAKTILGKKKNSEDSHLISELTTKIIVIYTLWY